ncbi:Arc family DNA-binding protein [Ciceribacter thiooxidans]|uniref:Arc family DNA-binding protein n=1 Tax=Ciceribacter thiooxidans TaxID=1969821 RepID=A0ABV7I442_9HYPH|nr:Arc family DNA-binding protein [Ciceribacter thiooxidans]
MKPKKPKARAPKLMLQFDDVDLRGILKWRDRIGLKTTEGAIKLAVKAGMSALAYEPRQGDPEETSAFVLRLSRSQWSRLLEASRSNGRSMREEALHRLEKSFDKPKNEKGGAPASETRSALSKSQPER